MEIETIESRLTAAGHALPAPPAPAGSYLPWRVDDGLLQLSGQVSRDGDRAIEGPLLAESDLPRGAEAATAATLRCLALLVEAIRQGHRVDHLVALKGYVASGPDFSAQPKVVDVASDLLLEALGDAGQHVRTAIGVAALPGHVAVELELTARCTSD